MPDRVHLRQRAASRRSGLKSLTLADLMRSIAQRLVGLGLLLFAGVSALTLVRHAGPFLAARGGDGEN